MPSWYATRRVITAQPSRLAVASPRVAHCPPSCLTFWLMPWYANGYSSLRRTGTTRRWTGSANSHLLCNFLRWGHVRCITGCRFSTTRADPPSQLVSAGRIEDQHLQNAHNDVHTKLDLDPTSDRVISLDATRQGHSCQMELPQYAMLPMWERDEGRLPWPPPGRCPWHLPADSGNQGPAGRPTPCHIHSQRRISRQRPAMPLPRMWGSATRWLDDAATLQGCALSWFGGRSQGR